jgi:hypothetical protein
VAIADRLGWIDASSPLPWEIDSHVRVLDPGSCPDALEGSTFVSDAVVAGRADRGDHSAPGEVPGRRA